MYLYKWAKVLLLFDHKIDYIKSMAKGTSDGVLLLRKEQYNEADIFKFGNHTGG